MKNPTRTLITRASLIGTASHNSRWFARILAGSAMFGTSALAVNNFWQGDVAPPDQSNWNNANNWSLDRVPANPNGAPSGDTFDDAYINIVSPAYPVLTSNALANPRDVQIGVGAATNGRLDLASILGGTLTCTGWCRVGDDGGTGVLNVGNTAGTGGSLSGIGLGTHSFAVGGRLYVGGDGTGAANGTANINTTGTISTGGHFIVGNGNGPGGVVNFDAGTMTVGGETWVGQSIAGTVRGKGHLKMSGGALTSNNWVAIGREGGDGTVTMTGGSWTKAGSNEFIIADRGVGKLNLPAGGNATVTINNQMWIGQGTSTTFGNGDGTLELHSGAITVGSWVAIGRNGGKGVANMSGGTWTKNGTTSAFIVGSDGLGTMTMTGGTVNVSGLTWIAEAGGGNGSALTLSGTAVFNTPIMSVGPQGNGTLHLNSGGNLRTNRITGKRIFTGGGGTEANTGTGIINFNGGLVTATASNDTFIADVDTLNVAAGGLMLDSNGFNVGTTSPLLNAGGGGGVTKSGAGTLTLAGANAYTGTTSVNAGTLNVTTAASGGGNYSVADGAVLGVTQATPTGTLAVNNFTAGGPGGATLNLNVADAALNPASGLVNVGGAFTLNGPLTLNVTDPQPAVGTLPLISHTNPVTGSGSFVLGTVPNGVQLDEVTPMTDTGGVVSLNIARVNAPYWVGDGLDSVWTTADNFKDDFTETYTTFVDGDPALFDDRAVIYDVVLDTDVSPGFEGVTFNNSTLYTLSGDGAITGTSGIVKQGSGVVEISTANTYTGITRLSGGTLSVSTLADGGEPSPIGASSDPANLVFAGGVLEYAGTSDLSIDRGFTVAGAGGGINTVSNSLEFEGPVSGTAGGIIKTGVGNLTLSNPGANVVGGAGGISEVRSGELILTGGGTQTVSFPGSLYVASLADVEANFTASDTAISVGNFFAAGRGNGNAGVSHVHLTNSTLSVGGFTTGYANGNASNESEQFVTLDNSTITSGGVGYLAESQGATATMTMNGTSQFNVGGVFILARLGATSTANVTMNGSSKIVKTVGAGSHVAIGGEGAGTLTMNGTSLFSTPGGDFNVGDVGSAVGLLDMNDDSTVTSGGNVFIGKNSTKGTIDMSGTTNMSTTGYTNVSGAGATSEGTLTVAGSAEYLSADRLLVGFGAASKGFLTVDGSGKVQVNSYVSVGYNGTGTMTVKGDGSFTNTDDFSVNENGDAPVTVTVQDTGSLEVGGNLYVGRNADRVGTLIVSGTGAEVNQTNAAASFNVGQSGTGTLNIQGSAMVTAASNNGVVLGQVDNGTGTVNLDGGTLTAKRIFGNAGTSTFNFHGGLLRAGAGATPAFFSGVDNAFVKANGAFIDSNGQNISVEQALLTDAVSTGGGLTKSGTGTLFLNGVNTYTGATNVAAGALGGTGTIVSPITVQAGAALAPGAGTGTLTATQGVTFDSGSTLIVNIDNSQAADNGRLDTTGTLNVSGVHLQVNVVNGTATPYTIVTAGTVTGTFASVTPGTLVSYNGNNITITPPASSPFESWISGFDTNGLDEPGDDADFDGLTNLEEFALDGDPSSGAASGKVRSRIETVGGEQALVITLPVRTGATFDNNPGPGLDATVVADDLVYLIKGSNDLATFDQGVTEIAESSDGMPELSDETKWSYRTFRLNGAIPARGARGFLTVDVEDATPAP